MRYGTQLCPRLHNAATMTITVSRPSRRLGRERAAPSHHPRRGRSPRRSPGEAERSQPALGAQVAVHRAIGLRISHHAIYGGPADGRLLAGIMGHNLCLDIFGGPSSRGSCCRTDGAWRRVRRAVRHRGDRRHARRACALPARRTEFERRLELRETLIVVTRDRHQRGGMRSADRLDPARDARAAISRARANGVSHLRHAVARVRNGIRSCGLPRGRRRLRLAQRATASMAAWPTSAALPTPLARVRTRLISWIVPAMLRSSWHSRRGRDWRLVICGGVVISRGSVSGKRTAAAPPHRGTVGKSLAAWSSACRRFLRRDDK